MNDVFETRQQAMRLAHALAGVASERAAQDLICTAALSSQPRDKEPRRALGDTVGIWRRCAVPSEGFRRDPSLGQATLWADVPRIAARSERTRVVLIGESCARAWPLDPLLTCADVMRNYVAAVPEGADVEVIDLARAGLLPSDLVRVVEEASALEPDVYVIFAGNNWHLHPDVLDRHCLADAIGEGGDWRAVVPIVDHAIRDHVRRVVDAVGAACRLGRARSLFVLPAENLRDRFHGAAPCNPLLTRSERACRREHLAEIDRHFDAGAIDRAADLSAQVIEMEGGISVAGWRSRGRCALASGDRATALHAFVQARESACYLAEFDWIHGYTVRLDECRTRGAAQFSALVDLSHEFTEASGGCPPGRELFLDQCHMTALGIRVSMAAVVSTLLPLIGLPARSPDELAALAITVDPRAEAQAHVVAAVMTAHDEDLRRFHCRRALEMTSEVAELMVCVARALVRRVPLAMADELPALYRLAGRFPAVRHLARSRGYHPALADLAGTIANAVMRVAPNVDASCDALLHQHHSVRRPLDLLAYELRRDFPAYVPNPRGGVVVARRPQQEFSVVGDPCAPALRLVWTSRHRQPAVAGEMAVLLVDGIEVHRWPVSSTWTTESCVIPSGTLTALRHTITIQWPELNDCLADRRRDVVNGLRRGRRARDGRTQYFGDRAYEFLDSLAAPGAELHAFSMTPLTD